MRNKLIVASILIILISLMAVVALGETHTVNNTMTTAQIQGIINGANSGDTISFTKGDYTLSDPLYLEKSINILGNDSNLNTSGMVFYATYRIEHASDETISIKNLRMDAYIGVSIVNEAHKTITVNLDNLTFMCTSNAITTSTVQMDGKTNFTVTNSNLVVNSYSSNGGIIYINDGSSSTFKLDKCRLNSLKSSIIPVMCYSPNAKLYFSNNKFSKYTQVGIYTNHSSNGYYSFVNNTFTPHQISSDYMPRAIQINPLPDDTGTDFHPFWANELTGNNFNGQILHYNFNGMFNGVLWLNDDELNPTGGAT